MAIRFNKEIRARANTRAEIGAKHLTDGEIGKLNFNRRALIEALGYDVGEGWSNSVPMTGMTPRMYIMQTDEAGNDRMRTFDSLGIKPGSQEFWRQVQLGNVFAFPSGGSEPVQMQVDENRLEINFSKPVNKENLPDPPAKQPSLWMRFAGLFGAYKKERAAWKNRNANKEAARSKLDDMKEDRAKTAGQDGTQEKQRTEKLLRDYDLNEDLEASRNHALKNKKGMELMTSIYHPQPTMKEGKGFIKKEGQEGLYTKKQFDSLKVYPKEGKDGFDLDKIAFGENGEKLDPQDFAAVTMYALWQPEIALKGVENQAQGKLDKYADQSILNYKDPMDPTKNVFKPEEIITLKTGNARAFWTGDLFIDPPRDNEGSYFKDVTNAGRQLSVDAFKAYAAGDKTKLAKIIADGLNMAAEEMRVPDTNELTPQILAIWETSTRVLSLMDKDPALKAEAEKQGLKPESLQMAEGMKTINRLHQEGKEAEQKLAEARVSGGIDQKELNQLTKAVLLPKLAFSRLAAENMKASEAEERMVLQGALINNAFNMRLPNGGRIDKNVLEEYAKYPEKRPEPKPGEMYLDTAQAVSKNLSRVKNPNPQSLIELGTEKGAKNLDKLADAVIRQEGLDKKDLEWVYNEFKHNQSKPSVNLADSIIKVAKNSNVIREEEPKPANDLQHGVNKQSVNDRKQMFEPQGNGPKIQGP